MTHVPKLNTVIQSSSEITDNYAVAVSMTWEKSTTLATKKFVASFTILNHRFFLGHQKPAFFHHRDPAFCAEPCVLVLRKIISGDSYH